MSHYAVEVATVVHMRYQVQRLKMLEICKYGLGEGLCLLQEFLREQGIIKGLKIWASRMEILSACDFEFDYYK